jgi:hypothetical protein
MAQQMAFTQVRYSIGCRVCVDTVIDTYFGCDDYLAYWVLWGHYQPITVVIVTFRNFNSCS